MTDRLKVKLCQKASDGASRERASRGYEGNVTPGKTIDNGVGSGFDQTRIQDGGWLVDWVLGERAGGSTDMSEVETK